MKRASVTMLCCLAVAITSERAFASTFTIDSTVSIITAAPTYLGNPLGEQMAGSLSAHVEGNLEAILSPTDISFPGGSNLDFISQLGPFNPGGAPADFAASSLFIVATLRNGVFDLTGSSRSVAGGSFEASTLASFLAGIIQVSTIAGPSSANLTGLTFNSSPAAQGSVVDLGASLELHVPVDGTLIIDDVSIHFTGEIVGTLSVPEPSSLALAAFGAIGLVVCGWRRKR